MLAITTYSFVAVSVEGPEGGKLDRYNFNGIGANSFMFYVMIPLFILIPIITKGFDSKLIGTLIIGALVGGILQDFVWFLVNPYFGLARFTSVDATWLAWTNLGFIELPTLYLINFFMQIVSWFVFFRNSNRVEKFYKSIKRN